MYIYIYKCVRVIFSLRRERTARDRVIATKNYVGVT